MKQYFFSLTPSLRQIINDFIANNVGHQLLDQLLPLTSNKATLVPTNLMQQLISETQFDDICKDNQVLEKNFDLPKPSLEEQQIVDMKRYKHMVGPKLAENISQTSLSHYKRERMFPVGFTVADTFATAITLCVLGWFLALARSKTKETQIMWACVGFVGGLGLDVTIYICKGIRADKMVEQRKKQQEHDQKKQE